jgi:hypothetical protein
METDRPPAIYRQEKKNMADEEKEKPEHPDKPKPEPPRPPDLPADAKWDAEVGVWRDLDGNPIGGG